MTVATYTRPNYTSQSAAQYKANIDGAASVFERLAKAFAPHEQDVGSPAPDLTVRIDAGFLWTGSALTEVAAQTVSGFTTPSTGYERIDRVVMNPSTGACTRVAGTAQTPGSPGASAPSVTSGCVPVCQIAFTSSSVAITNSMITDERIMAVGLSGINFGHTTFNRYEEGTWTPSLGGTATYTSRAGRYTRVGRLYDLEGFLSVNSIGTGSTTTASGAPYASGAAASSNGSVSFFSGIASNVYSITARMAGGGSDVSINCMTAAGTQYSGGAIFQNGARVDFSVPVQVA